MIEALDVRGDRRGNVALRVDRDEYRRNSARVTGVVKFRHHAGQVAHVRGADTVAIRKPEEDQQVPTAEVLLRDRIAVLVRKRKGYPSVGFIVPHHQGERCGDNGENEGKETDALDSRRHVHVIPYGLRADATDHAPKNTG